MFKAILNEIIMFFQAIGYLLLKIGRSLFGKLISNPLNKLLEPYDRKAMEEIKQVNIGGSRDD